MNKANIAGDKPDPVWKYLQENAPELHGEPIPWNFSKFLVNEDGDVVHFYEPKTTPNDIIPDIEELLDE